MSHKSIDDSCSGDRYWCHVYGYPATWADVPLSTKVYALTSCILCAFTGILGNGIMMLVTVLSPKLRKRQHFLLFFACLEAFLTSLLVIPISMSAIFSGKTIYDLCFLAGVLTVSFNWFRVTNNFVIIIYQFIAVYFPTLYPIALRLLVQTIVIAMIMACSSTWWLFQYSSLGDVRYGWEPHLAACYINIHDYQKFYKDPTLSWPITIIIQLSTVMTIATAILFLVTTLPLYRKTSQSRPVSKPEPGQASLSNTTNSSYVSNRFLGDRLHLVIAWCQ